MLWVGFTLYVANLLVGAAAQWGAVSLGRWHHALYASVFATSAAATFVRPSLGLALTLAVLAVFPFARPRTPLHPLLGLVGLAGYLLAWAGH